MPRLMYHLFWVSLIFCCDSYAMTQSYILHNSVTAIEINGEFDVRLHTDSRRTRIAAQGDERDLARLMPKIKDGVLVIQLDNAPQIRTQNHYQYQPIQIDIHISRLERLVYRGQGQLSGRDLHSRALELRLNNSGSTRLEGSLDLRRLTVAGPGQTQLMGVTGTHVAIKLRHSPEVQLKGAVAISSLDVSGRGVVSAYWLDSRILTVRARDNAQIQLAGVAQRLDLELWDNAKFHGRYLRADEAFIKAHDRTLTELTTTAQQHTFAQDNSDVLFYNEPLTRNDFMSESGAVLDMRGLKAPAFIGYDTVQLRPFDWRWVNSAPLVKPAAVQPVATPFSLRQLNWVSALSVGPIWEEAGATQSILLAPDIEKTYIAQPSVNGVFNGELFVGVQQPLRHNLQAQLGLAASGTTQAKLSGVIWDTGDANFENYTYSYQIQHTAVTVKGKLLADFTTWVMPWLSASAGVSFNNASAFQNTPLIFQAVVSPNFASQTTASFTYTLGAGLEKTLSTHWQIGAGYEFSDWGKSQLGAAAQQTMNTGLGLNHLYTNGLLFNLTYLG